MIGLKKYNNIKNIAFHKIDSSFEVCSGYFDGKRIVFNPKGIEETAAIEYNNVNSLLEIDGPKIDAFNFICLSIIFHELTHARQDIVVKKKKNTLETELFSICNRLLELPNDFYIDNYSNFPVEVNAFSKGGLEAFSIYSKMPKEYLTENDYCCYATYTLSQLIRSYDVNCQNENILSPAERTLLNANNYNLLNYNVDIQYFTRLVTEPNEESIYKKLILGLPISFMEYAYVKMLQIGLEKKQKVTFVKKLQRKL